MQFFASLVLNREYFCFISRISLFFCNEDELMNTTSCIACCMMWIHCCMLYFSWKKIGKQMAKETGTQQCQKIRKYLELLPCYQKSVKSDLFWDYSVNCRKKKTKRPFRPLYWYVPPTVAHPALESLPIISTINSIFYNLSYWS